MTYMMTEKMTRQQVAEIIAAARAKGEQPNLTYANLDHLDLTDMDLADVDLTGANLTYANLTVANLAGADLTYANLHGANLLGANLRGAHLQSATMTGVNPDCANLDGANLDDAKLAALKLDGLPSGTLVFLPSPTGWYLTIGCWEGTTDDLREMIAGDDEWPAAQGAEIAARRPMLAAAAYMCDAFAAEHFDAPAKAKAAADRWKA